MQTKFRHIITPWHLCLTLRPSVIASDDNDGVCVVDDDGDDGKNDGDKIWPLWFILGMCLLQNPI